MSGVLGFALGAACIVVVFGLGRWLASVPFRERSVFAALVPWADANPALRAARAIGGCLGWYVGCALVVALATMTVGVATPDYASMRVTVAAGGPAARAGIRTGDRILAVEGGPVLGWFQLKEAVAARTGVSTRLTIERNGDRFDVTAIPEATPPERGMIRVGPFVEMRPVRAGTALGHGLTLPFRVLGGSVMYVAHLLGGSKEPELAGPVGIVKEASKAPRIAIGMELAAAVLAYFWPLIVVTSLVLAAARRAGPKPTPAT